MKRKWLLALPLTGMLLISRMTLSGEYKSKTNILLSNVETEPIDTIKIDTLIDANDTFSIINFKKYLEQKEIPHPHVVYAIARHESGFRSSLFMTRNNMFGMRNPGRRPTMSTYRGKGWADFEHWTHAVDDFLMYMQYCGMDKMTESQFLARIDGSYAGKSGYSTRIKKHFYEYQDLD